MMIQKQLTPDEQLKVKAALDVCNNSILFGIDMDIEFVKGFLPEHYKVKRSNNVGSVHCVSPIGFVKPPYEDTGGRLITDAENEIAWQSFMCTIKAHFGKRFQEVYHNTCYCHVDFTIYLKERK